VKGHILQDSSWYEWNLITLVPCLIVIGLSLTFVFVYEIKKVFNSFFYQSKASEDQDRIEA
jgi:hypothetical protein